MDVDALWTLVLALLGPRSFLGWPGMMGMENGMGEAASRCPVASVVLSSAYSLWSTLYTETMAALGDWDRSSSCVSLRTLLKEFPVLCARAVRSWNLVHYFFESLLLAVLVPGVWVLP